MDQSEVVGHLGNTLAFYANHVATRAKQHQPRIRSLGDDDLSGPELAAATSAWAQVLDAVLRSAPRDL